MAAARQPGRTGTGPLRRGVAFLAVLALLVALWEGYKFLGAIWDGTWPILGVEMRPRPGNGSLPHVWDVVAALVAPARRNAEPLILTLLVATIYTLREALVGFLVGAVVGFGIGVVFVRSLAAERAFMPYVVASQTIPIIAVAPMVVVWGRQLELPGWTMVSIIAAYLTFFPVAINTVRGLRSPEATATELFDSYAATPWQRLTKLQIPSALPYIFTALKISAAASVVGAIVGELPAGFADGLGRALLQFNQTFAADPSKLYAAVLMSAIGGIAFVGLVAVAERLTLPSARREVTI
ncbi:MAG TPA: ABC transporter permease [Acidimicrobiia bacterium]|nr:ABC transporter permease [Acidimicrobiia bacterium]HZI39904.1 ABC transporter permease [Acidimicrobiia bacterium]